MSSGVSSGTGGGGTRTFEARFSISSALVAHSRYVVPPSALIAA